MKLSIIKELLSRFYLPILFSLSFFIVSVDNNHFTLGASEIHTKILFFCACGFFLTGSIKIICESRQISWKIYVFICVLLMAPLLLAVEFLSGQQLMMSIIPALVMLVCVSPFILKKSDDFEFSIFNLNLWKCFFIAGLTGAIVYLLFTLVFISICYLFGFDTNGKVIIDFLIFSCSVFVPLYVLTMISCLDKRREQGEIIGKYLKFFIQYISTPFMLVYLTVFYVYFLYISIGMEMPKGKLSYMVMGLGSLGVVNLILVKSSRLDLVGLTKFFSKYFMLLMIVPVCMLSLSIGIRVNEYGVTEDRYMVMLFAIWISSAILFYLIKKGNYLKTVTLLAISLLVLSSFGPWSASSVSISSQLIRLELLLVKNNILVNDKIVKLNGQISFNDEKAISSIIQYMLKDNKIDKMHYLFGDLSNKKDNYIYSLTGTKHISNWNRAERDSFHFSNNSFRDDLINVSGYDYLLSFSGYSNRTISYHNDDVTVKIHNIISNKLLVEVSGYGLIKFDLTDVEDIKANNYIYEISNDRLQARLIIEHVSGKKIFWKIQSLRGKILLEFF